MYTAEEKRDLKICVIISMKKEYNNNFLRFIEIQNFPLLVY